MEEILLYVVEWTNDDGEPVIWFVDATRTEAERIRTHLDEYMYDHPNVSVVPEAMPFDTFWAELMEADAEDE